METLPQEIIFDILLRLPVKSVVRCRCVCKSWRSLISKSQFVKTHLNLAITEDVTVGCQRVLILNYILLSGDSLESIDYEALQLLSEQKLKEARKNKGGNNARTVLPFPWSSLMYHLDLLGSCHGMVGMVVNDEKIIICNPCTREFRELPKPPSSICSKYLIKNGGGLGYDSSVDDYKFVIAFNVKDDNGSNRRMKAEVFSLRSNSWRMVHDVGRVISGFLVDGSGVFLNGALHWIASSCGGFVQMIISFDMVTEKFQDLLPLPPDAGYRQHWNLTVLGGYLSVSCRMYPSTQVWVKKEYSVEAPWTKLYALDIQFNKDLRFHYLWPLCFSKNGELLVNVDHHIIIYNPKEQTYRKLYHGWWSADNLIVAYTESLVSPNGNVEYNYLMSKISSNSHRTKTKIEEC